MQYFSYILHAILQKTVAEFWISFNSQTFFSIMTVSKEYNGMRSRKFYYVFSKGAIFRSNFYKDSGTGISNNATWKKKSQPMKYTLFC